jgi:hypothetical protein
MYVSMFVLYAAALACATAFGSGGGGGAGIDGDPPTVLNPSLSHKCHITITPWFARTIKGDPLARTKTLPKQQQQASQGFSTF